MPLTDGQGGSCADDRPGKQPHRTSRRKRLHELGDTLGDDEEDLERRQQGVGHGERNGKRFALSPSPFEFANRDIEAGHRDQEA